jgi:hypothetical protein
LLTSAVRVNIVFWYFPILLFRYMLSDRLKICIYCDFSM